MGMAPHKGIQNVRQLRRAEDIGEEATFVASGQRGRNKSCGIGESDGNAKKTPLYPPPLARSSSLLTTNRTRLAKSTTCSSTSSISK